MILLFIPRPFIPVTTIHCVCYQCCPQLLVTAVADVGGFCCWVMVSKDFKGDCMNCLWREGKWMELPPFLARVLIDIPFNEPMGLYWHVYTHFHFVWISEVLTLGEVRLGIPTLPLTFIIMHVHDIWINALNLEAISSLLFKWDVVQRIWYQVCIKHVYGKGPLSCWWIILPQVQSCSCYIKWQTWLWEWFIEFWSCFQKENRIIQPHWYTAVYINKSIDFRILLSLVIITRNGRHNPVFKAFRVGLY